MLQMTNPSMFFTLSGSNVLFAILLASFNILPTYGSNSNQSHPITSLLNKSKNFRHLRLRERKEPASITTENTRCPVQAEWIQNDYSIKAAERFREVSYLAYSTQKRPDNNHPIVWVGSDGKWRFISAVDLVTGNIVATFELDFESASGADWESISLGPCSSDMMGGKTCLYIGDIGNNGARNCGSRPCDSGRDTVNIYKVEEPILDGSVSYNVPLKVVTIKLNYHHEDMPIDRNDCEAMFVDWMTGNIYMITKHNSSHKDKTRLVKIPVGDHENLVPGITSPTLSVIPVGKPGIDQAWWTGADMSRNGRLILARTTNHVYFFNRSSEESVENAMEKAPCSFRLTTQIGGDSQQFEAVTILEDNILLEASECKDQSLCDVKVHAYNLMIPDPPTWVDITADDFESGWGSFESGGRDSFLCQYDGSYICRKDATKEYAHSGVAAVRIQDNSGIESAFTHKHRHDVTMCDELRVQFSFCVYAFETNEKFYLRYHNGDRWLNVVTWMIPDRTKQNNIETESVRFIENSRCYSDSVSLSPQLGFPSDSRIRFINNASRNNDRVYIDDVVFSCLTNRSGEKKIRDSQTKE